MPMFSERCLGLVEERVVEVLADPAVDVLDEVLGDLALLGDRRQPDAGRGHVEARLRQVDRFERIEIDRQRLRIVHLLRDQFRCLLIAVRLYPRDAAQRRPNELLDRLRICLDVCRRERQLQTFGIGNWRHALDVVEKVRRPRDSGGRGRLPADECFDLAFLNHDGDVGDLRRDSAGISGPETAGCS